MKWQIPLVAVIIGLVLVLIFGLAWENPHRTSDFLYGYPFHWFEINPSGAYFLWTGFFVDMQLYSLLGLAVSFLMFTSKEKTKLTKVFVLSSLVFFCVGFLIIFPRGGPVYAAFLGALLAPLSAFTAMMIYGYYRLVRKRVAELPVRKVELKPTRAMAVSLIVLLSIGTADATLAFTQRDITDSETVEWSNSPPTLDTLVLTLEFTGDITAVNVDFENLEGKSFVLNVSATAKAEVLVSTDLIHISYGLFGTDKFVNGSIEVNVATANWPWYSSINSTCNLQIDPSIRTSLNMKTEKGKIITYTKPEIVLDSLNLETNDGEIQVSLAETTVLAGDISLIASTGNVTVSWNNVTVPEGVLSNVEATAEKVNLNLSQDQQLLGNATLKANATADDIGLHLTIYGIVSARIESNTTAGVVNVERQNGFSRTDALLQSDNFPSNSSLDIALFTTSGAINIDATHSP